jgi:hypothetical protein
MGGRMRGKQSRGGSIGDPFELSATSLPHFPTPPTLTVMLRTSWSHTLSRETSTKVWPPGNPYLRFEQ